MVSALCSWPSSAVAIVPGEMESTREVGINSGGFWPRLRFLAATCRAFYPGGYREGSILLVSSHRAAVGAIIKRVEAGMVEKRVLGAETLNSCSTLLPRPGGR